MERQYVAAAAGKSDPSFDGFLEFVSKRETSTKLLFVVVFYFIGSKSFARKKTFYPVLQRGWQGSHLSAG